MDTTPIVCTYRLGNGTCLRPDCPKCCVRNYRDQMGSDLPVEMPDSVRRQTSTLWARRTDSGRGLFRWLSRI
jgi:hypothetical protein